MLLASGRSHTAAARLRASLEQRLQRMIRGYPMRMDYAEKLQETIDRYNARSSPVGVFFAELQKLARSLDEEQDRHMREELSEEELAMFDLLTKPDHARETTAVFEHIFSSYQGSGKSVYDAA